MCHVLIIEDEWLIASHVADVVERAGATSIALAATEVEAIASARERVPTIILSDVDLAEGTGPHAVALITSECGSIPVIFITGKPEACAGCAPPFVILPKPVEDRKIVEAFRHLASTLATAPRDPNG